MTDIRKETDSLGVVEVPAHKLWGSKATLARTFQHWQGSDPPRDDHCLRHSQPNLKKINEYVETSLMLVTSLSPVIGYDKASKIAHYAADNDLTLKEAALKLGFVT